VTCSTLTSDGAGRAAAAGGKPLLIFPFASRHNLIVETATTSRNRRFIVGDHSHLERRCSPLAFARQAKPPRHRSDLGLYSCAEHGR
jgi:hypothetical protein